MNGHDGKPENNELCLWCLQPRRPDNGYYWFCGRDHARLHGDSPISLQRQLIRERYGDNS